MFPDPPQRGVESDGPRRDEQHRSPHVPPGRRPRHGLGPEPGPRPEGAGRPREGARRSPGGRWARPASRSRCSTRGPSGARASTASSGSPSPTASAPSTPPRSTAPSPTSRSGSTRPPRSASRSSWSPRTCPRTPSQMIEDGRPAAGDPGDRLHRPLLHPRPRRRPQPRRRHQPGQEPGVQGDGRGDPEVGQGQVHRLLDPPQGPRPDHPGGGRGRDRRRDHAPVHPLARQGLPR